MHKRRDVDELHDDGKIDVVRVDLAGGAAGQKRQNRTKAFAATPYRINNIALQRWIKSRSLLRDARFDFFQMRLNEPRYASQRAKTHDARPG